MYRDDFERDERDGTPLERSEGRSFDGQSYSREASNYPQREQRREYQGRSEGNFMAGNRRRRRISEMTDERPRQRRHGDFQEMEERSYRSEQQAYREREARREQSSYYREQYQQQREGYRQRYNDEEDTRQPRQGRPQRSYHEQGGYQSRGERRPQGGFKKGGQQRRTHPQQQARKRRVAPVYDQPTENPDEEIRLNKFLSNAGVCSRREADELIKAGAVVVNGVPVTELGTKITSQDYVEVNGKEIKPENKVYVLLNKPRNCVTTTQDPQERLTVMHLVRSAAKERIYPVGRLDRNTTGVLLLTNDGDLAAKLVHPSFKKRKIYHVWLDKEVTEEDMQKIADGVELEDGWMQADAVSYVDAEDRTQVGIEIHSGRNRIVRRIFEHLGYHVMKLDRVYFAGLTKKNLGRGKWRYLTQEEVNMLMMGSFD